MQILNRKSRKMINNKLFADTDPLRNRLYLDQERWNHIINDEPCHPEFAGEIESIRLTVVKPNLIIASRTKQGSLVYFKLGAHSNYPKLYVKVPVDYSQGTEGRIQTAMLQHDLQGASFAQEGDIKYVKLG